MRRFAAGLGIAIAALGVSVAPASAAFGLKDLDVSFSRADGSAEVLAGSHPFAMTTSLSLNTSIPEPGVELPEGAAKDLFVELPPGFTGSANPVPYCSNADFVRIVELYSSCPNASAVGYAMSRATLTAPSPQILASPVFNLPPPPGVAARLGFAALELPVTIDIVVSPDPPYNLIARVTNITQVGLFYGSDLTLWGNPVSSAHDALRGRCIDYDAGTLEPVSLGKCSISLPEKAFITLPRSCGSPLLTDFEAVAWNTGDRAFGTATTPPVAGCQELDFGPQIEAQPTTSSAEGPTGLDFGLEIDDEGLLDPEGRAASDIKKTVVTLPEGVTVNASQAEGLGACTPVQFTAERSTFDFGAGCPGTAKIGSLEVETPLLEGKILKGSAFVASPYDNPFNSLIALYMTIKNPELGINVGIAGKVELDPSTGQLVAVFDDLPQIPFSDFRFHFNGGARSPLTTPPECGVYETTAESTPWANPATTFTTKSSFEVTSGIGGGPCPQPGGTRPFAPTFEGGSVNNNAGAYSPFYMRITRADSEQNLTRLSSVLPKGVTGKLAGIPKCADAAIALAPARTGLEEQQNPSCPAASQVGRVLVGAGVGPALTYVPGKVYLAGPYNGAPLSVAVITPAVAGPFDIGNVVVRTALRINPVTAEVEVDGSASDPIPPILAGIPLKLRDLRVYVDRPDFTLNPTSCDPDTVRATLFGSAGTPVSRSSRYQAADCASLRFKPRLSLTLRGGTKRSKYPALTAVLRPRQGDANIGRAVVALPHTAFLAQNHIRTICTRPQFAARACPPGSVYGKARAFTPLLDAPLEGAVYLRANGGERPLPDLVVDLRGEVDFELVGHIDSKNAGIRTTFATAPDAPVSKFVLRMRGGQKGLLENSSNLCRTTNRADVRMVGQNAKIHRFRPVVKPLACKGKSKPSK